MSNNNHVPDRIHWKDITYVVNNLPEKDMQKVDESIISLDAIDDFMVEQIENGGQFKFSYDYAYGQCPNISLVFYNAGYDNSGYGVSARGRDFKHCMQILMYKFYQVANGELFNLTEVTRNRRYG